MLWFPTFFARFLPGWFVNVATIIHSDEALLATGFIFTIHFFNTHLRPEKFPMDIVIFTGRMTVEELKHDKPAEYEALVASGKLEEHLVVPYQPIVIRTIRAFAWTALANGIHDGAVDRLRDAVRVRVRRRRPSLRTRAAPGRRAARSSTGTAVPAA